MAHSSISPTKAPQNRVTKFAKKANDEPRDIWYYPKELANDLKDVGVPESFIEESIACAWEYTRIVIPQFTNWERYIAFCRLIEIAVIVEFKGELVDVMAGDHILGFDLGQLLETVYGDIPAYQEMSQEFRSFLLLTADKCSNRRDSDLYRRYADALAQSPAHWFRLRDCDALLRFTIAAALTCNDVNDVWFSEDEMQILAELGCTMYDTIAFYKHRAEGEINSTFAYVGEEMRQEAYRCCREVLWALDAAWGDSPAHRCVVNLLRTFGGPLHMMARRYRFIEDGLKIGKPETEEVVAKVRDNFKLWYRVDSAQRQMQGSQLSDVLAQGDKLLFPGLEEMLQNSDKGHCRDCKYPSSYGAQVIGRFGGVQLCEGCKHRWNDYVGSFPLRAAKVFPMLQVNMIGCRDRSHL